MKIGLCLSGGCGKGAAHIGAIKALTEFGVDISAISGTGLGALIASLYAVGYEPIEIKDIYIDLLSGINGANAENHITKSLKNNIIGIFSGYNFEKKLHDIFIKKGAYGTSNVKIPLAIPAVDINTTKLVMFVSDKKYFGEEDNNCIYYSDVALCQALRASYCVPVLFKPKKIKNHYLIDGSIRLSAPIFPLYSMGCKKVISIHIGCPKCSKNCSENLYNIVTQTMDIMSDTILKTQKENADFVLELPVCDICMPDNIDEEINAGYNKMKEKLGNVVDTVLF